MLMAAIWLAITLDYFTRIAGFPGIACFAFGSWVVCSLMTSIGQLNSCFRNAIESRTFWYSAS